MQSRIPPCNAPTLIIDKPQQIIHIVEIVILMNFREPFCESLSLSLNYTHTHTYEILIINTFLVSMLYTISKIIGISLYNNVEKAAVIYTRIYPWTLIQCFISQNRFVKCNNMQIMKDMLQKLLPPKPQRTPHPTPPNRIHTSMNAEFLWFSFIKQKLV